jgi:hypothetical protein
MVVLRAEWRPADQTLEHDGSQRPPIAVKTVAVTSEDFGGDVVRGTDSGIGHQSSRSSPIVDLGSVANGKVDLVNGDRATITGAIRSALEQLLVIVVVVKTVEASGETEIGQLDVTTSVKKDIVGLDITN